MAMGNMGSPPYIGHLVGDGNGDTRHVSMLNKEELEQRAALAPILWGPTSSYKFGVAIEHLTPEEKEILDALMIFKGVKYMERSASLGGLPAYYAEKSLEQKIELVRQQSNAPASITDQISRVAGIKGVLGWKSTFGGKYAVGEFVLVASDSGNGKRYLNTEENKLLEALVSAGVVRFTASDDRALGMATYSTSDERLLSAIEKVTPELTRPRTHDGPGSAGVKRI